MLFIDLPEPQPAINPGGIFLLVNQQHPLAVHILPQTAGRTFQQVPIFDEHPDRLGLAFGFP
jgi:hypothetical protein